MYITYEPSEVILEYKGVNLYGVYRDDDREAGLREYWFGTEAEVSDALSEEEPCGAFDIRVPRTRSIPMGSRTLARPYVYDNGLAVADNLKRLIDLGGIDFNDGHPVECPKPVKTPGKEMRDGIDEICARCEAGGLKEKFDCGSCLLKKVATALKVGKPPVTARGTIRIGDEVESAPGAQIRVKPFVVTGFDDENRYFFGFNSDDFKQVQGGLEYAKTGRTLKDVLAEAERVNAERKKKERSAGKSIFLVTCEGTGNRFVTEAKDECGAVIYADFAGDLLDAGIGVPAERFPYTVEKACLEDVVNLGEKNRFRRICGGIFLLCPKD